MKNIDNSAVNRQKNIALINDFTGFGRCSLAVEIPIVSALKVQACAVPTAILSAHTGFYTYYMDDYTRHMTPYIQNWEKLNLHFDGIATGFLGSSEQIRIVRSFLQFFKKPGTLVIVDPVMGDDGAMYASYTKELCTGMKELLPYADVILPNLTEACILLDEPYPGEGEVNPDLLQDMCRRLCAMGPSDVIITGLSAENQVRNYLYEKGGRSYVVASKRIGGGRAGTGDVFAAVVSASLVRGENLQQAVEKAARFISRCLEYTNHLGVPWNEGLCFEEFLVTLQ